MTLLTVAETAKRLNLGTRTVWRLISQRNVKLLNRKRG